MYNLILPKNKMNNLLPGLHRRVCGTVNRGLDSALGVSSNGLYVICWARQLLLRWLPEIISLSALPDRVRQSEGLKSFSYVRICWLSHTSKINDVPKLINSVFIFQFTLAYTDFPEHLLIVLFCLQKKHI